MDITTKIKQVYKFVEELIAVFSEKTAQALGYPQNPGMPRDYSYFNPKDEYTRFFQNLPKHKTFWPPLQDAKTWTEMIFGVWPKGDSVHKYRFDNLLNYTFFIENYKDMYFLPDKVSEFLQINCDQCIDITLLEATREAIFIWLMIFTNFISFRILMSWFISINPYTFPWYYIVAVCDWTEDALHGLMPVTLGVNVTATVFISMLGVLADGLNRLVFTMPFLPSEGELANINIDDKNIDVILFHNLPNLWYRYPIPNELREFWYNERPDILAFLIESYKNFDIKFLPDNIVY